MPGRLVFSLDIQAQSIRKKKNTSVISYPGGHLELFDRLDDADSGVEVFGAILIFILPKPEHRVVWRISVVLESKQGWGSATFA